jgi:hypothetical protein
MARVRNDFGEDRVAVTVGYQLVPAGQTITVPDDEVEHWIAGGWTLVEEAPAVAPAKTPIAAAAAAAPERTDG